MSKSFKISLFRFPTRAFNKVVFLLRSYIQKLNKVKAVYYLKKVGVLEEIEAYIKQSGSTGCSYSDYEVLHRAIVQRKPKEILECGTGVSTIVMAHAVAINKSSGVDGRITSMEELPEYYAKAKEILPEKYVPLVDLILSETIEDVFGIFRGIRYSSIPNREYDFMFVDGPNTTSKQNGEKTFDADLLYILKRQQKDIFGFVDGRSATSAALFLALGPGSFSYDYSRGLGVFFVNQIRVGLRDQEMGSWFVKKKKIPSISALKHLL